MQLQEAAPTSTSREFNVNEMFFSTTDPQGRILAGNEVFARVAGYAEEEMIGRPHNLIRHPDMPRGAFAQLWVNMRERKPFQGYVKNQAKNGAFYWVFASIMPLNDGTLLSIRFKPSEAGVRKLEGVYATVLAEENRLLKEGFNAKDTAEEGRKKIQAIVQSLGYPSYDEFAEEALVTEMEQRDAAIDRDRLHLFPPTLDHVKAAASVVETYARGLALYRDSKQVFEQLHAIADLSHQLADDANAVVSLASDFHLSAINTNITSTRFGSEGHCISVIASFLTGYAGNMDTTTAQVREQLRALTIVTHAMNAAVAMSRLQLEMILFYQAELATGDNDAGRKLLPGLVEAFRANANLASSTSRELLEKLDPLSQAHDELARSVVSIEMAQVRGLMEATRISEGEALRMMFEESRSRTVQTRQEVDKLGDILARFRTLLAPMPAKTAHLTAAELA